MKQDQPYHIKTIDLQNIDSVETLHSGLARVLNFPDFYGNNWDAFWDTITGLVKMPTNFIIYNKYSFYKRHEKDANIFGTLCYRFNELRKEEIIQNDVLDGLILGKQVNSIECIFETRPSQFGLRGDDHLWQELESYFGAQKVPENEELLVQKLHEAIENLTAQDLRNGKDFFVEKYNTGGMSSGWVNAEFWLRRGIPLLIGRFRNTKESL